MPPAPTHKMNREAWLNRAIELFRGRLFAQNDLVIPANVRISVGFPKGTRGKGAHSIGQCWAVDNSADKHSEIFIHPELSDPSRVLDVTAHELVHVVRGHEAGHGKLFKQAAVAIGLEGKMTATVASAKLKLVLSDYASHLGPYPHAALNSASKSSGPKKQGTRMLKILCNVCGYTARTSAKWIDVGLPTCCCGEEMVSEDAGEEGDE